MNRDLQAFMDAAQGYRSMEVADRPLVGHQVVAAADEIERLRKIEAAARNLAWDDRGLLVRGVKELCEAFEDADGGGHGS